jgi:transcriptional regulator with XRE-family HTH domain
MSIAYMPSIKRTITDKDRAAAKNLRGYWAEFKKKNPGVSQTEAGARIGFSQAVFSQYLLGKTALGFQATAKFAGLFGCKPAEIRPDVDFSGLPEGRTADQGSKAEQSATKYKLDADAIQVAHAWAMLSPLKQQLYRDAIFRDAAAEHIFPWLKVGRPKSASYEAFEQGVIHDYEKHIKQLKLDI